MVPGGWRPTTAALGCILLFFLCVVPDTHSAALPVSYGVEVNSFMEQKPLMGGDETRSAGTLDQRYVAPVVVQFDRQFRYAYDLVSGSPLTALPLSMRYRDGDDEGLTGAGWRMTFTFPVKGSPAHNILSPCIKALGSGDTWLLSIDGDTMPATKSAEGGKTVYRALASPPDKTVLDFVELTGSRECPLVPLRFKGGTYDAAFEYSVRKGAPLLRRVGSPGWEMDFEYREKGESCLLGNIRLSPAAPSAGRAPLRRWGFAYREDGKPAGPVFLSEITVDTAGEGVRTLRYAYALPGSGGQRSDLAALFKGEPSSLWKRGEPWRLPGRMSLKRDRGLRFFEIDKAPPIDLVNVREGALQSWVWDRAKGAWREYGPFAPQRKLMRTNGAPAGSQFTSLWKDYSDYPAGARKHETNGYQSIVTGYYLPQPDGTLTYRNEVCFPNIVCKGGLCGIGADSSGNFWDCDSHGVLQLPLPLQYEGDKPWPENIPGVRPREDIMNQGAQFVSFGPFRNGLHYYAIWLRYIDEKTGLPLLGPHRNRFPENCRTRYVTEWSYHGGKKKVRVEACQAFWGKRGLRWMESDKGKEQWVRLDVDERTGSPNGNYTLPWHGPGNPDPSARDPNFNYHYEGFRNVTFATLRPGKTYAIVHGAPCDNCPAESKRPPARHIYEIKGRRWTEVDRRSPFYAPGEAFEAKKFMFTDVNNDGYDDLIQTDRRPAKVFINISALNGPAAWRESSPLRIPHGCNLLDDCRFVALLGDGDNDLDLFAGDGETTWYNRSSDKVNRPRGRMTSFTDENGKVRSVKEHLTGFR